MKNVILVIVMLIQVNAFAMGGARPAEQVPPVPVPAPPPAPQFSDAEKEEFIRANDFYTYYEELVRNVGQCSFRESNVPFFEIAFYNKNSFDEINCLYNSSPLVRSPVLVGYKFKSMSRNGKNYILDIEIRSPLLKNLLSNREDRLILRYEGSLATCDDAPLPGSRGANSLEEIVDSLNGMHFSDFFHCNLSMKLKVVSSDFVDQSLDLALLDTNFRYAKIKDEVSLLDVNQYQNGAADFNFGSPHSRERKKHLAQRSSRSANPEARATAFNSTKEFISLLKSHGIEIARSAMLKNVTEHERQMILMQSLLQKKGLITAALKNINDSFANLEMIDKLSVATSIGSAYEQVKILERKVGLAPDYSLMLELNPFELQN